MGRGLISTAKRGIVSAVFLTAVQVMAADLPVIGPAWSEQVVKERHGVDYLPYGLTEFSNVVQNESPLSILSVIIYRFKDQLDQNQVATAAKLCRAEQSTWEKITCAHRMAEQLGYDSDKPADGFCRVLSLTFRQIIKRMNLPNVFVTPKGYIFKDGSGHSLNNLIVRTETGATYSYMIDVEYGDSPVMLFPYSLTARQYHEKTSELPVTE